MAERNTSAVEAKHVFSSSRIVSERGIADEVARGFGRRIR